MQRLYTAIRNAGLAIFALNQPLVAQELPNIIVVYADDLGYGDLSCYNAAAAYETPRLDRMAAETGNRIRGL